MRTEKSRLRRSLMSLQELMRRMRHHRISDQVSEINAVLRGHYAYYGVAGNIRSLRKYIGSWSVTGSGCCAAAVGPQVASPGTRSTRSNSGRRYSDPNCVSPTGSCRHSRCCESTAEEPGAGNLHAGFCGNGGRVTASRDPVMRRVTCVPTVITDWEIHGFSCGCAKSRRRSSSCQHLASVQSLQCGARGDVNSIQAQVLRLRVLQGRG